MRFQFETTKAMTICFTIIAGILFLAIREGRKVQANMDERDRAKETFKEFMILLGEEKETEYLLSKLKNNDDLKHANDILRQCLKKSISH